MKKQVLVVGGDGQLGCCLKSVLDRYSITLKYDYLFANHNAFDITNKQQMLDFLKEKNIKIIINCAAYTNVKEAETEDGFKKAMLVNHIGVKYLAEVCKEMDIFLIHFGTDYMYDYDLFFKDKNNNCNIYPKPMSEENNVCWWYQDNWFQAYYGHYRLGKINKYGYSKLMGVHEIFRTFINKQERNEKQKFVIIVVSWLYSKIGKNFFNTMKNRIKNHEKTEVIYTQIGSPTYAMDLADYLIDVIENDNCVFIKNENKYNVNDGESYYHIMNFANLGVASWYDIAKVIDNHCGFNFILPREEPIDTVFRPGYSVLSLKKLLRTKSNKPYVRHWTDALEDCMLEVDS